MTSGSPLIIAIDQGTTSSRVVAYDRAGREQKSAIHQLPVRFPQDGWVEQDPLEIWDSVDKPLRQLADSIDLAAVEAIGITNQRETIVSWNRKTGEPIGPAIVWQCRRTAPYCAELRSRGLTTEIRRQTGLVIDPYFSATKIVWLLENVPAVKDAAGSGEVVFGTVDSWVLYKLTGGAAGGVIATEPSNASRTMLVDLATGEWSDQLLSLFSIRREWLPEIRSSAGNFGTARIGGHSIPVTGILGDQQASLFGNGAFTPGQAKCTFGTGAFLLANIGSSPTVADDGLLTTIGWKIGGEITYAREGSVFVAGSAVQWLRDGLGLIKSAAESEQVAASVATSGGVFIVPAFTGLGAPYWDSRARGVICGITRDTTSAQIVRATLEGVAHQVADLLDTGGLGRIELLGIDGGMSSNGLFAGILADITGIGIQISPYVEMTAFGAARVAAAGLNPKDSIKQTAAKFCGAEPGGIKKSAGSKNSSNSRLIAPGISPVQRAEQRSGWREAVSRTLSPAGEVRK